MISTNSGLLYVSTLYYTGHTAHVPHCLAPFIFVYSLTGIYAEDYSVAMDVDILSAMAEPNRLKIIELLREQPRSVNEIALLLDLRQPQVSKHLQSLHQAGLVTVTPVAQKRVYTLNKAPFLQLQDWASTFHAHWNKQLNNLEDYLNKE
jgi:DNA-binding transcriptional ArsR family regulator